MLATRYSLLATSSIDVALVALLFLQLFHKFGRSRGGHAALLRNDVEQGGVHILGHALGVATDIEISAALDPGPELGRILPHPVLHVKLEQLIPREGGVDPRHFSLREPASPFLLVEIIRRAVLIAEEHPIAPGRAAGDAVLH